MYSERRLYLSERCHPHLLSLPQMKEKKMLFLLPALWYLPSISHFII